jgi:diacylglycerol kinase (ATP)
LKLILIHNPRAGQDRRPKGGDLLGWLRGAGYEVLYQSVRDDAWADVLHEPAELVVVAGGDGAVRKVILKLTERRVDLPLAILPIGTANNVSRTLGLIDTPLDELILSWPTARRVGFATGTAKGPWGSHRFIESVGAGFIAFMMATLDRQESRRPAGSQPRKGLEQVRSAFRQRLQEYPGSDFQIRLDEQDLSGNYLAVEAMNIKHGGPSLPLAPAADPTDNLLDLVLVPASHRQKLLECLSGQPAGPQNVSLTVGRGKRLQIQCSTDVHVDDESWPEPVSTRKPGEVRIDMEMDGQPINILLPRRSPARRSKLSKTG